jgi:flagellum-specific peptidoglycan hydrolase FlgJ
LNVKDSWQVEKQFAKIAIKRLFFSQLSYLVQAHTTCTHMRILYCLLLPLTILCLSPSSADLDKSRPGAVSKYLTQYRYLSKQLSQSTSIPEPVILAIAGLESNWGKSELAVNANNHFGIKSKPDRPGLSYCKQTLEYEGWFVYATVACFRRYPLISESYTDFGDFILTRDNYSQIRDLPSWNYRAWVEGLREGGYATDPGYTDKVLRIIWRYHLYELPE